MEVHHHAHHGKKKWTEYFWEFLMLFLAVFCGFLAENLREHFIETKKEKQYLSSLVRDLGADTSRLRELQSRFEIANRMTDTLILLLKSHQRDLESCKIYNLAGIIPFSYASIEAKDQTFQQLKSSGNLRLIHDSKIVDSLGSYYQRYISLNNGGPAQMLFQNRHDVYLFAHELFDMLALVKRFSSDSLFSKFHDLGSCEVKPTLLTNDPVIINKVCSRYFYLRMSGKAIMGSIKDMLGKANWLLANIKKEYNLD